MHWLDRVYRVESGRCLASSNSYRTTARQAPRLLLVDVALIAPAGATRFA